jgi:hypothetical protein
VQKASELENLSVHISAYSVSLASAPIPARSGLQPGPPGAGKKPAVPQEEPAAKPNKGKGKKGTKDKEVKMKKNLKKKKTITLSDEEDSENDDESEEDEDQSDEEDDLEEGVYIVEAILGERAEGKMMQYLVKWQGFEGEDTWEPTSALKDNRVFKAYKKAGKKVSVQNHTAAPVAPAPAAKPAAKLTARAEPAAAELTAGAEPAAPAKPAAAELTAGAEPAAPAELAADKLEQNHTAAPVAPAPAAKPPVQRQLRAPRAAKQHAAAEVTAADIAEIYQELRVELGPPDPAKLATKRAVVACRARVPRRAPIAAAPIAQQLNFLTCSSMDFLSDICASADRVITDPDKAPKPAEEASAEAEETAEEALVAEETVAPPVAQHAQPAKRQRIGGPHQIAHIELDAEDGPPQIRSLPLEAGPFAGVWVEDGEQIEIIGALINDSRAGEIYQQVLYRCISGYIKSKYIRYATEN